MSEISKTQSRLLIVGYYFTRTQSAGGHRLFAMVKYLSRRGWDITVLTAARDFANSGESDENAVGRYIPAETRVIRTGSLDFEWLWTSLQRTRTARDSASGGGAAPSIGSSLSRIGRRLLHSWKVPARWVRGILSFPDRRIGWFFPLMFHSWKLLRQNTFDAVLTSGPPHSSHLPFLFLRRCFRFVWICDFRDPWTDPPLYATDVTSLSTKRVSLFLNRLLETCVLRSCDRVLANTVGNGNALGRTFGKTVERKLMVLTNGFDEEITPSRGSLDESVMDCDFVFTGAMYPWMLDLYVEALKCLRNTGYPLPTLHVFGTPGGGMRNKVHENGLDDYVSFKGAVSYEESLWVQSRARALLLLFVSHNDVFKYSVPSKLYAYLFSRRPYLALVPDGDAARVLEEVGGGVIVKSNKPSEVADGIASFLHSVQTGTLRREYDETALARYSWSNLSSRLEDVLRNDVERNGRTTG